MYVELSAEDLELLKNEVIALRSMLDTVATGNEASFDNMCRLIDSGLFDAQFDRNPHVAENVKSAVESRKSAIQNRGAEWIPGERDEELRKMFGKHV